MPAEAGTPTLRGSLRMFRKSPTVLIFIALGVLIALTRLHTYREPVDWDVATYAVIAHEVNLGERLYADAWDMKPPAIFATYVVGEWIAGYGYGQIYLLGTLAAIATMLGIYFACATFGRAPALFAAACFAIVQSDMGLEANRPNTEAFINACTAWTFALLLRMRDDRTAIGRAIAAGALIGVASLYKHVALAIAVPLLIAYVCTSSRRWRALAMVSAIFATIVLMWLAVWAWFAVTGRGEIFIKTVFEYPRFYARDIGENLFDSLAPQRLFARVLMPLVPLVAMTLAGLAMVIPMRRDVRTFAMLLALVLGTQAAIALPRQFFAHYYQLWLVPLCVGAGLGLSMLLNLQVKRLALATAVIVLGLLAFLQFPSYLLPPDEWAHRKHGPFLAKWLPPVAREIDEMLAPHETFYQWADEPWLYFATRRRPPAAGIWRMHTVEGPVAPWLAQRTLEDLRAHPPKLIVIWDGNLADADHPIARFILDRYSPVPNPAHRYPLVVFERRDAGTTLPQR